MHTTPSFTCKTSYEITNKLRGNLISTNGAFYRIQQTLATVIYQDVLKHDGMFHGGNPCQEDITTHLELQCDYRDFNMIGGYLSFPVKPVKYRVTMSDSTLVR
jgi:hypothetical protein